MATQTAGRPSISDTFGLLPESRGRFGSFAAGLAANALLAGLFFWIAMAEFRQPPPVPRYQSTELIFQTPPPPPAPVKLPPVPKVQAAPVIVQTPPKIQMPQPLPEPPKPEIVRLNTPAMPAIPPAPPRAAVAPPQPKVGLFASPKPTAVANNQSAPTIKTGGFGDPSGVQTAPNASRPSTVAAVGVFNAAPGTGQGAGAARQGFVQGTGFNSGVANGVPSGTSRGAIASAGFVNGVAGGTPGGAGRGSVSTGGFGATGIGGSGASAAKAPQQAVVVPPEVTFEPHPQYTDEARQLKIQGEVTLQVKFGADGKIEVLRVVSGLGHGLDEQAERVAQQIRFKPGLKNGQPADNVTYIHILFQLA